MASTAMVTGGEEVSVSRVISRAIAVIRDNPATVFGIAFAFVAVPTGVLNWLQQNMRAEITDVYREVGVAVVMVVQSLIGLVFASLAQGALVGATIEFTERRRASFGECASIGLANALPLVGLTILLALAVFIGLAIFIVPGVILFMMWAVASPVLVAERTGVFGAFGRSRQLTKGARWKVFGVELVILAVWWGISAVVGVIMLRMIANSGGAVAIRGAYGLPLSWVIMTAILSTLLNAFWSTVQTSLYVELRNWKDGHTDHALEEIFA